MGSSSIVRNNNKNMMNWNKNQQYEHANNTKMRTNIKRIPVIAYALN